MDSAMNPPAAAPNDTTPGNTPPSEAELARILALNGLLLSPEQVRAIAPGVVIIRAMLARVNAPLPREAEPALIFNAEQR